MPAEHHESFRELTRMTIRYGAAFENARIFQNQMYSSFLAGRWGFSRGPGCSDNSTAN
jgi:hypothetical protein